MEPIKINKFEEPVCKLFNSKDQLVGTITSLLELNDIRIQITKKELEGYYIIWNDYQIFISKYSYLDWWPEGFYDTMDKQLDELLELQSKKGGQRMKIKRDFVTNSSTCSYVVDVLVDVPNRDDKLVIAHLKDIAMIDIVGMIEARLRLEGLMDTEITLNVKVVDLCCDGWGGDYNFAGNGGAYVGDEGLALSILSKNDVKLKLKNGILEGYPESWKYEGRIWIGDLVDDKGLEWTANLFKIDKQRLQYIIEG